MESLPEIAESDAGPDLQPIYADIKGTVGTATVNLIYRHIATIPVALPWVWTTIKDGIGHQRIKSAAERIPLSGFGKPLPAEAFSLLGLAEADVRSAARVVAEYNRANAFNLVGVTALRHVIERAGDGSAIAEAPPVSPAPRETHGPLPALPLLVPISAMQRDTLALVRRLSSIGTIMPEDDGVFPSLYRHLAHWPAYLALSLAVLEPLSASGALESARQKTIAFAEEAGQRLADFALEAGVSPIPSDARVRTRSALDRFSERVIPKMLPIGHTLLALTPERLRPGGDQIPS